MENKEPYIENDKDDSDSSENLSHEEWTIIDENCTRNADGNDVVGNDKDQEPSRGIEVMAPPIYDNPETGSVIVEKNSEDSDGISVITESEAEQPTRERKFGDIHSCRSHLCNDLKIYGKLGEKTVPQAGIIWNVVIACSLTAIIGLGAGRILSMDDKCQVTNAIDFPTIKIENDMLIDQIRELSEVKDVLDQIKASIPQVKRKQQKSTQRKHKSGSKNSEREEKPSIISNTHIFDADMTILEQLQNSLNTLCSVIDGMNPGDDLIKSDTSRTQNVVANLIEFKKIVRNVVEEVDRIGGRPEEMEFLRQAEKSIRNVCESLLSDLSYTVHSMAMKIHHKLNKVRHKLNKRLCLLKNSTSIDERIFKSLKENDNSFLESCDRILNVTLKPNSESIRNNQRANSGQKISSKTQGQFSSVSDDNVFPRDSCSDSLMPDRTYDYDSNNFWQKKLDPVNEAQLNSRQVVSENDSKCRKIQSITFTNTNGGQSSRKSLTELLNPRKTCPLNQECWSESVSVYPELRRLDESSIPNERTLYSIVLKSNNDAAIPAQSNANNDKSCPEVIREFYQEFRASDEKDTSAENVINDFENQKSAQEQLNTKYRKPFEEYDGVESFTRTESREEFFESNYEDKGQFSKHCAKGKKCSNISSSTTRSSENFVSNTRYSDSNEYEKDGNKKPKKAHKNKHSKKEKMGKRDGKVLLPLRTAEIRKGKDLKKRSYHKKVDDGRLTGDWQLQRSQAREMRRNNDHRSEWFFDRADFRQDARKNMDVSGGSECYRKDKCESILEEGTYDEEFYDYWKEVKNVNGQKHSKSRFGFGTKKATKMPHRKNILQSKRR